MKLEYCAVEKLPFTGYAKAYKTTNTNILGEEETIIQFGRLYESIDDGPKFYEYPIDSHKLIGTVKISIEKV